MAKHLLTRLLQSTATSRLALAREITAHHSPLSDVAIRKFQTAGQSIPPWFWAAIDVLLNAQPSPKSASRKAGKSAAS